VRYGKILVGQVGCETEHYKDENIIDQMVSICYVVICGNKKTIHRNLKAKKNLAMIVVINIIMVNIVMIMF
jgi:hypothetical protein